MDHVRAAGFQVEAHDVSDAELYSMSRKAGVPEQLGSCHTAMVGGYAVEGHVPAADIARLLKEQPAGVAGIAVPGMPLGSPGMEQGGRTQPYEVFAFARDGKLRVFSAHP